MKEKKTGTATPNKSSLSYQRWFQSKLFYEQLLKIVQQNGMVSYIANTFINKMKLN